MADEYRIHPITTPDAELELVQTAYGGQMMERWKARALAIGWMQRQITATRADGAAHIEEQARKGTEHELPPPLKFGDGDLEDKLIKRCLDMVERLDQRMTALEARRAKEDADAAAAKTAADALGVTEAVAEQTPEQMLALLEDCSPLKAPAHIRDRLN